MGECEGGLFRKDYSQVSIQGVAEPQVTQEPGVRAEVALPFSEEKAFLNLDRRKDHWGAHLERSSYQHRTAHPWCLSREESRQYVL